MKKATRPAKPRVGRPLSFDREAALQAAMLLFWRHGYESTSLSELTKTMGITAPSVYAAFGDKKHLFRAAVNRYLSGPVTSDSIIREASTARAAAEALLQVSAVGFTGANTPAGCLLASSVASCSAGAADVQKEVAAIRTGIEASLTRKIAAATRRKELPAWTDAGALAAHIMAVIQGMSTLARDGATRAKLLRVADVAMQAWPAAPA